MSELLHIAGTILIGLAAVGVFLITLQASMVWVHRRRGKPVTDDRPGISILKPLCGVDEELEENLRIFATLPYPNFELLLGVKNEADPAYPYAVAAARRWPERVRVCLQQGTPGLNPKINQLITLTAEARHDILLVSDSNVRVEDDYLHEIAGHFANPKVGLITHPVMGMGEESVGARFDSLHLGASIGPGMIAAKVFAGKVLVVGKSMGMRREVLRALGGFEAFKDILAEDYFIGRAVTLAGIEVAVAHTPVWNFAQHRGIRDFLRRYVRWSVMQRMAVGWHIHGLQVLLNPVFIAALGFAISPSAFTLAGLGLVSLMTTLIAAWVGRMLRPGGYSLTTLAVVPLKELTHGFAWATGFTRNTIDWRGNRRVVLEGTRLALADDDAEAEKQPVPAGG